ncbi:ferrous iron transport protein B [Sphingobacteriales bacterium UPWRP_1]|nr:ferrous iron transport protein B [Sphingobacteriales bacterium TSM_CSM]PSJ78507.1 ferrous iron transport protein B [Sphingobacteriales bacterium UPWRP_1]
MQPTSNILYLAGNPNSGKTSVFNHLTGLHQKVGNFSGVTVEKKSGTTQMPNGVTWNVVDLPGAYSLHPTSAEEYIVLQTLLHPAALSDKHTILYIADATNLERHLLFCTQLICLGYPLVIGLTMTDMEAAKQLRLNTAKLSELLGVPVFSINGRTGQGLETVKQALCTAPVMPAPAFLPNVAGINAQLIQKVCTTFKITNQYGAALLLQHVERLPFLAPEEQKQLLELVKVHQFKSLHTQVADTMQRFDKIVPLIAQITTPANAQPHNLSQKLDQWITNPVFGLVFFCFLLFAIFQAIFSFATYPMDWIEQFFAATQSFIHANLPNGFFTSLLADGLVAGLGGIVMFVPQIAILFLLIGILEETGYMARAVYLSDNLMRRFGLNGRSLISLFSGMACAVPAVMATRTITNSKERLLTIMVTPLISCSARIPVYTILIALLIPANRHVGMFNAQGLMMMALYITGVVAALAVAAVMKRFINSHELSFLALELPPYRLPHWKNLLLGAWQKVKVFIAEAGKIILIISFLLWGLSNFGPGSKMQEAENRVKAQFTQPTDTALLEAKIAEARLENSWVGHLGKIIEPAISPIGFDWKIGIALLTSFAAREVFVGTMATIYSVGGSDEHGLRSQMRAEVNPNTGKPVFSTAGTLSLLVFYIFAMQCMSTLAVVKRETNSWKWALIQLAYMTILAYGCSFLVFRLFQ